MVEQQKKRLERAVGDLIEDMYKTHLRKIQMEMHKCAARCCENERGSLDSIQVCIEKCATPLMNAQDFLQNELEQFQQHLQGCVKDCNIDVRSKMPQEPTRQEITRSQQLFEDCTGRCVDKHISLLPSLMKSMKAILDGGKVPRTIKTKEQTDTS